MQGYNDTNLKSLYKNWIMKETNFRHTAIMSQSEFFF